MEAGDVEHRRHLSEAPLQLADQLRARSFQGHLAGRHRAGAELFLEPVDPIPVAAAVGKRSRDQEESQPGRPGAPALRPCQRQDHLATDVGAEELAPIEAPAAVLAPGLDRVGADV